MNYIVLEGICLYVFIALIIITVLISILSLIALIITDNRNSVLNNSLYEEKAKVKYLIKANFKLRLKYGEFDCDKK